MSEIKTAILGGSFDPVHLGHLFLLNSVLKYTDYRRIIVVPASVSNFKQDSRPKAPDVQRMKMLTLAMEDYKELYPYTENSEIIISDTELKAGGVSYTYNTVMNLKKEYGINERIGVILGDDHIRLLRNWYKYKQLIPEVEFVICPRESNAPWSLIDRDVHYVSIKPDTLAVESSTEIRNNLKKNESFLSRRVKEYVRANNIYM